MLDFAWNSVLPFMYPNPTSFAKTQFKFHIPLNPQVTIFPYHWYNSTKLYVVFPLYFLCKSYFHNKTWSFLTVGFIIYVPRKQPCAHRKNLVLYGLTVLSSYNEVCYCLSMSLNLKVFQIRENAEHIQNHTQIWKHLKESPNLA